MTEKSIITIKSFLFLFRKFKEGRTNVETLDEVNKYLTENGIGIRYRTISSVKNAINSFKGEIEDNHEIQVLATPDYMFWLYYQVQNKIGNTREAYSYICRQLREEGLIPCYSTLGSFKKNKYVYLSSKENRRKILLGN